MKFVELAVESARYHSRMAVRAAKYFNDRRDAAAHRAKRDGWMKLAKDF